MRAISSKAASIARPAWRSLAATARTATYVPSSGRARSTGGMGKHPRMGREQAADAVGDVLAREGRARDVFDVARQLELGAVALAGELGTPRRIADLVTVALEILEDLDALDRALRVERERIGDELVLAQH